MKATNVLTQTDSKEIYQFFLELNDRLKRASGNKDQSNLDNFKVAWNKVFDFNDKSTIHYVPVYEKHQDLRKNRSLPPICQKIYCFKKEDRENYINSFEKDISGFLKNRHLSKNDAKAIVDDLIKCNSFLSKVSSNHLSEKFGHSSPLSISLDKSLIKRLIEIANNSRVRKTKSDQISFRLNKVLSYNFNTSEFKYQFAPKNSQDLLYFNQFLNYMAYFRMFDTQLNHIDKKIKGNSPQAKSSIKQHRDAYILLAYTLAWNRFVEELLNTSKKPEFLCFPSMKKILLEQTHLNLQHIFKVSNKKDNLDFLRGRLELLTSK